MRTPNQRHSHEEWEHTTEEVDLKIVQLAVMCNIRLLEPGVINRVLDNDTSLCHSDHQGAFEQLRGMVFLHYEIQKRLAGELGAADAAEVVARVRQHLLVRVGTQLGTPR
ncbi:hypothetical protein SAMN05216359_103313 [Roseateles sp. YR242]|uniref:hypothetical protein n=1 Tax=Roseateles sp. YR242 TaxID=1855305 RepID=UPI0008B74AB0|nr:hypothetical protein [Roseateles sp. YR242]SEK84629.1 hypothetical protein SAMN05216359_103313 [Roseateles sp. YR242]